MLIRLHEVARECQPTTSASSAVLAGDLQARAMTEEQRCSRQKNRDVLDPAFFAESFFDHCMGTVYITKNS